MQFIYTVKRPFVNYATTSNSNMFTPKIAEENGSVNFILNFTRMFPDTDRNVVSTAKFLKAQMCFKLSLTTYLPVNNVFSFKRLQSLA